MRFLIVAGFRAPAWSSAYSAQTSGNSSSPRPKYQSSKHSISRSAFLPALSSGTRPFTYRATA